MKVVILFSTLFLTLTAHGIRRVGFGGGPAELRLHQMAEYIPLLVKACQENENFCGPGMAAHVAGISFALLPLKITGDNYAAPFCDQSQIVVSSDLLYVDEKTPRSDIELAQILLRGFYSCLAKDRQAPQISDLLPLGGRIQKSSVFWLTGNETDVLVSQIEGRKNLHQDLILKLGCAKYRVLPLAGEDSFVAECQTQSSPAWRFLVETKESATATEFSVHYLAD